MFIFIQLINCLGSCIFNYYCFIILFSVSNWLFKTALRLRCMYCTVLWFFNSFYILFTITHFYIFSAPKEVARPEIDKIEKGNIKFRLTPASEENGGISHYFLIVVPILNNTLLRRPQDYQFNEVKFNVYKENKS